VHVLASPAALHASHGGDPVHFTRRTRHVSQALLLRRWGPVMRGDVDDEGEMGDSEVPASGEVSVAWDILGLPKRMVVLYRGNY